MRRFLWLPRVGEMAVEDLKPLFPLAMQTRELKMKVVSSSSTVVELMIIAIEFTRRSSMNSRPYLARPLSVFYWQAYLGIS